jgi:hypothetical protein
VGLMNQIPTINLIFYLLHKVGLMNQAPTRMVDMMNQAPT